MARYLLYILLIIANLCRAEDTDTLQHSITEPDKYKSVNQYLKMGLTFADKKNDSALYYFNKATELAKVSADTNTIINTSLVEIKYLEEFGKYADALQCAENVNNYLNTTKLNSSIIEFTKTKGRLYWKNRDWTKAKLEFQKLRNLARKISNKETEAVAINNIGLIFSETGNLDSALSYHHQSLMIYMDLKSYKNVSSTYNLMGNACLRLNKYDEAINNYYESNKYAAQAGDSAGIARSLSNLAKAQTRSGNTEKAISNLNQALNIWKSLGNDANIAVIYNELGSTYRNINNYTRALENFQHALQIRRNIADIQQIAATLNNIGTIYKDINMPETALEYYEEALTIHQNLSNDALIALSLNYIGGVYYKKGQYDHALDYYLSALGYCEIIGDKIENARILNNIAMMYKNLGNYNMSLEYYKKSLELYRQISDHKRTSDIINNIGNLYLTQKLYKEAKSYFLQSLRIRKDIKDYKGVAQTNYDLAIAEAENHNITQAITYLQSAWNEKRVDLGHEMRRNIALKLSELYERRSNFKSALLYRYEYEAYNDSLINQDLVLKLTEVKTQYEAEKLNFARQLETEKKEAEIKAIVKEQKMRETALIKENRLEKSIRNLFILLTVAAIVIAILLFSRYRVKNKINLNLESTNKNLNTLNAQLEESKKNIEKVQNTKDKLVNIIIQNIKLPFFAMLHNAEIQSAKSSENKSDNTIPAFIQSTSSIYNQIENTLNWAKLQKHSIELYPERTNIYQLIDDITSLYKYLSDLKQVEIKNLISKTFCFNCDPVAVSIVFSNLMWYRMQSAIEHGKITIKCTNSDDSIIISIFDNGDPNENKKIARLINIDGDLDIEDRDELSETEKHLFFCLDFVKLWGGKLNFEVSYNNESKIDFLIPSETNITT